MSGVSGKRNSTSTFRPMGPKLPSTSGRDPHGRHACGTLPFSLNVPSLPVQHLAGTTWSVSAPQKQQKSKHVPGTLSPPVLDVLAASHCCIWCISQSGGSRIPWPGAVALGNPALRCSQGCGVQGWLCSQVVHLTQWSRRRNSQHDDQDMAGSRPCPWPCCQGQGQRGEESASGMSPRQPQRAPWSLIASPRRQWPKSWQTCDICQPSGLSYQLLSNCPEQ